MNPLSDAAIRILDVCEQALTDAGIAWPARRYISLGQPELSCCDTLNVYVPRLDLNGRNNQAANNQPVYCLYTTLATFIVTIARDCFPVAGPDGIGPPSPSDVQEASVVRYDDWWTLWTALFEATCNKTLFEGAECYVTSGGPSTSLGPDGGCAGSTITLTARLLRDGPG